MENAYPNGESISRRANQEPCGNNVVEYGCIPLPVRREMSDLYFWVKHSVGSKMTSKDYKSLLAADLSRAKREQIKPADPDHWRRGQLRDHPSKTKMSVEEVGELFEVVSEIVVNAAGPIKGKRLHGASAVRTAFAEAGLDPRNPNHWYQLLQIFADAHYLRRPTDKTKKRSMLDEIKEHAESIRKKDPKISKTHLIDRMKESSNKYPSEATLAKLLQKAGVCWYKQSAKQKFGKKQK